jgi:hypothetical protein
MPSNKPEETLHVGWARVRFLQWVQLTDPAPWERAWRELRLAAPSLVDPEATLVVLPFGTSPEENHGRAA